MVSRAINRVVGESQCFVWLQSVSAFSAVGQAIFNMCFDIITSSDEIRRSLPEENWEGRVEAHSTLLPNELGRPALKTLHIFHENQRLDVAKVTFVSHHIYRLHFTTWITFKHILTQTV